MTATAALLDSPLFAGDSQATARLLLATDGSPESASARAAAVDLAGRLHAELHMLHAWLPLGTEAVDAEREARRLLFREQLDAVNQRGCVHATHLVEGDAARSIIDTADECRADLIVMGGRRLDGFDRWRLGSVSDPVARLARCSVLVVRAGPRAWPPDRVVVGPHAGDVEMRAAFAAATLLGAAPPPPTHRDSDLCEELTARTLTVLVRGRHRIMVDPMTARRLHAVGGPVLVLARSAVSASNAHGERAGHRFLFFL